MDTAFPWAISDCVSRSGYLLEISAPSRPEAVDRFLARSPEAVSSWVRWALGERRARPLVELALEDCLVLRVSTIAEGLTEAPVDLRKWLSLTLEDLPPARLTASSALAALRRRVQRQPEDWPSLVADLRGLREALPVLSTPTAQPGDVLRMEAGGALCFGANLVDPLEGADDPDPPPRREVPLPPQSEPLFEAVWARPDDDEPRAVLADCLEEAGHPWGTFLQLQLARSLSGAAPGREEEALLEAHAQQWLGDLHRLLTDVRWERGFPVEASLAAVVPGLLRRRALSTLRRLRVFEPLGGPPLSFEALSNLRTLTHAGPTAVAALANGACPALEALHCGGGLVSLGKPCGAVASLAAGSQLEHLKWLELDEGIIETPSGGRLLDGPGRFIDASDFEWLWPTRLGRQLDRFGTITKFEALASWLRRAPRLQVPVLTLRVCQYSIYESLWVRLERGSPVVEACFREVPEGYDDWRSTVGMLLGALDDSPFSRVVLEHAQPERIEAVHLRDPRLEIRSPGPIERFARLGLTRTR